MKLEDLIRMIENTPGFKHDTPFELYVKFEGEEQLHKVEVPEPEQRGARLHKSRMGGLFPPDECFCC
jgi:hypothetical protein